MFTFDTMFANIFIILAINKLAKVIFGDEITNAAINLLTCCNFIFAIFIALFIQIPVEVGLSLYLFALLVNHIKNLGEMAAQPEKSSSEAFLEKIKSKHISKQKEYFYNQCEVMRESVDEMKSFHHDTIMHLSAISGLIKSKQYEESLLYIENLTGKVDIMDYSDTGNTAVDSIINYKLRNAKANGVDLSVSVNVPSKLQIDDTDVVSIIGNILDNALTALEKSTEKKLTLDIKYSKGGVHIFAENSHSGNIKQDESGQIITTKTGSAHGYGIKNIRKSIEKYNGDLDVSFTDTSFTVEAFIYAPPV